MLIGWLYCPGGPKAGERGVGGRDESFPLPLLLLQNEFIAFSLSLLPSLV